MPQTTYAHLLVVSNDTITLTQLGDILHQLGKYTVTMTNSTIQAKKLLSEGIFDLVLLDVRLVGEEVRTCMETMQENISLPIIVAGTTADLPRITQCLENGASDYLRLPTTPPLLQARLRSHLRTKRLQEQAVSTLQSFNELEKLADDLRLEILPLGIALSTERNFDRLLERIVVQAMNICNADAGMLYLHAPDNALRFAILRINSLNLFFGGTTKNPAPYADIPLHNDLGEPNRDNVATYVALDGMPVNIDNIYSDSGFDFSETRIFDLKNNYRSISCLTVPIANQEVIGILQLINAQEPNSGEIIPFDVYHQLVAEALASLAAITLHNRRLRQQGERLLRFKQELEIGRRIQAGFLPSELPQPPGWELVARFQPAREVAGDFYDAFPMPFGKLGLIVADVCDKGIAAALFMALVRSLLRASIQQHYYLSTQTTEKSVQARALLAGKRPFLPRDSAAILDAVRLTNAYIGSNHGDTNMFATLFFGVLDPTSGQLIYVNCGHNPPVILEPQGIQTRLFPSGPALGLRPDAHYKVGEIQIRPGATLFAFTDGITEARGSQDTFFGRQTLFDLLEKHAQDTAVSIVTAVETAVRAHNAGVELSDDITMLAVRRKPHLL